MRLAQLSAAAIGGASLAVLLAAGTPRAAAIAPIGGPSGVCQMQPLEVPPNATDLKAATTSDGMLFASADRAVWVRGPWGWEIAWRAPEKIVDLTTVAAATGDVLIVATADALHELSWQRTAVHPNTWARLRFQFSGRQIATMSPRRLARGGDDGPVRGFVSTQSGELLPLRMTSTIETGTAIHMAPAGSVDVLFARLSGGWTAAWHYLSPHLYLLGPDGTALPAIDLRPAIASVRPASVRSVWYDDRNDRLFIGTDYGLMVAATASDSPRLASQVMHVAQGSLGEVGLVTRIAGRVAVAFSKSAQRLDGDRGRRSKRRSP